MTSSIQDTLTTICASAFEKYLDTILASPQSHGREKEIHTLFQGHMTQIGSYIYDEFYTQGGVLSDRYIRGLHQICYPPGYSESRNIVGGKVVTLVPGVYKSHSQNVGEFIAMVPAQVKTAMGELVTYYKNNLLFSTDTDTQIEQILFFLFQFFYIHPFADANGRIGSILVDSMLIYFGHPPIEFKKRYDSDANFRLEIKKTIQDGSFENFIISIYRGS